MIAINIVIFLLAISLLTLAVGGIRDSRNYDHKALNKQNARKIVQPTTEQQLYDLLRTPCKPTEAELEKIVLRETQHLQSGDVVFGMTGEYYEFFKGLQAQKKTRVQLLKEANAPYSRCEVIEVTDGSSNVVRLIHDATHCEVCVFYARLKSWSNYERHFK